MRDICAAIGGEYFDAVRSIVDAGKVGAKDRRPKKLKTKKPKKRAPEHVAENWEFPATVRYVYGLRAFQTLRGPRSREQKMARQAELTLVLLGMPPDADLAFAELQHRLDGDRSADAFAAFLESWRNGDESFYEALDRTAGTKASVFFYDAMLGDFVTNFAKGKGDAARKLKKSLDGAHDALHDAFLCYRQYRAFREAVALSLLLPPDVPLPQRLRRYEVKASGGYSLREQVMMLLAVNDYDPIAVVDSVRESAEPLADPLWSSPYDPYASWRRTFDAALPIMLESGGDTDAFLAQANRSRLSHASKMRSVPKMVGFTPTKSRE